MSIHVKSLIYDKIEVTIEKLKELRREGANKVIIFLDNGQVIGQLKSATLKDEYGYGNWLNGFISALNEQGVRLVRDLLDKEKQEYVR